MDAAGKMHRVSKGAPEQVVHITLENRATYKSNICLIIIVNSSHPLCRFSILHITDQTLDSKFMQSLTSLQNVDFVL